MNKKQLTANANIWFDEKRKCIDCLYCKVCAMSPGKLRLCFCSETKNKEREIEAFWLNKSACKKFEDMSA